MGNCFTICFRLKFDTRIFKITPKFTIVINSTIVNKGDAILVIDMGVSIVVCFTTMSLRNQCKSIAKRLVEKNNCFVLGKGYGESVAMEGSLKLKEIGYIHAEGYSGGALKHGPFALINDDSCPGGSTPVILLVLDDEHANQMRTVGEQVKARGADLVIITDKESLAEGLDDNPIVIPSNGDLTALIGVFPLQMIAYELSLLKGVNPDTPKNLAKSVTTD